MVSSLSLQERKDNILQPNIHFKTANQYLTIQKMKKVEGGKKKKKIVNTIQISQKGSIEKLNIIHQVCNGQRMEDVLIVEFSHSDSSW